jgi:putative iron-dependent peroxidase
MLERMFLGDPPARHDRILDFSTPVTGSLFFVPSVDFLDDPPDPPAVAAAPRAEDRGEDWVRGDAGAPHDGERPLEQSLGIGDLKGSDGR